MALEPVDFDRIAREEGPQAARLAEWFALNHPQASVLDVGCGPGLYTEAMRARGVHCFGVDNDPRLIESAYLMRVDITREMPSRTYDLVLSLEVGEHLPAELADRYLSYIALAEPRVVYFSAAQPGQGGEGHINCQRRAYWCERFLRFGYWLDPDATDEWLEYVRSGPHMGWLARNGLVLRPST